MNFPSCVKDLPATSGVYIFHDSEGNVLYVGKAKDLRKRVSSYLHPDRVEERKRPMLGHITDMEYLETASEADALTLETDLIKSHRPPWNVRMMDDKGYSYILFSKDDFPCVRRVYGSREEGELFGPYLDSYGALQAVNLMREAFGLRDCKNYRKGGCVNRHIGICAGPCQGGVTKEEYAGRVAQAKALLRGSWRPLRKRLSEEMEAAAKRERFEEAARLRDVVGALDRFLKRRTVLGTAQEDEDVVAIGESDGVPIASVLAIRDGRVALSGRILLSGHAEDDETLSSFLLQYYSELPAPGTIVVDRVLPDAAALEEALAKKRGKAVAIVHPEKGRRKAFLDLARRNARLYQTLEGGEDRVDALQRELRLPARPVRIEAYDISHLGGQDVAASMAVFVEGKPSKADYRWFKVRTDAEGDDARIREVLERRRARLDEEGWGRPDLVLVDGGKTQVAAGAGAFKGTGIPVIGLAKREEEIFMPGISQPLRLERNSPALLLLMSVRDEAHRFANSYRRRLKADSTTATGLDSVPGVGPAIRSRLLARFGSTKRVSSASVDDIAGVEGVGRVLAIRIKKALAAAYGADGSR